MNTIPISPQEITLEWLNATVAAGFPESTIEEFSVTKFHSGTTGRARLELIWSSNKDGAMPETVFVKLPPVNDSGKDWVVDLGMGAREARFYKELQPEIPANSLGCYYSDWNEKGTHYIMVMEDLRAIGARPAAIRHDHSIEFAEQIVDQLAALHGKYWASPRFAKDLNWITSFPGLRNNVSLHFILQALKNYSDKMPASFAEAGGFFLKHHQGVADLFERGAPTLIHGDAHLGNLYVDGQGNPGFLDWAMASKMPGMWDISYLLTLSFPHDFCRQHEQELLRRYRQRLAEAGGPERAFDELWNEYRRYALYSWLSAAVTIGAGDQLQPLDIVVNNARWASNTLEELDVLSLIRAEI